MLRASLLASAATIALIGQASAQQANNAFIGQMDESNFAYLSQEGSNQGFVYQFGGKNVFLPGTTLPDDAQRGSNTLGTMQLGERNFIGGLFLQTDNNIAGIAQFGNDNVVNKFLQTGTNRGAIFQGGDGNVAQSEQTGTGNDVGIIQLNPTAGGQGTGNYRIQHADRRREPGYLRFLLGHPSGRLGQHSLRASDPADRF